MSPYDALSYSFQEAKDYHQLGLPPPGTVIPPINANFYPADSFNRRKESTSFEHEQPLPSAVTR